MSPRMIWLLFAFVCIPAVANADPIDKARLKKQLVRHEGKRLKVYKDSEGIPTIGVGFNLRRQDAKAKIEAFGLNFQDVLEGRVALTDAQVDSLLVADIDAAIKTALGYKMGPCELLDLIGLDTQLRLCEAFYPVTLDVRSSAPPLLRRMVAAGHLGRKSGRGFYVYEGSAMFGG